MTVLRAEEIVYPTDQGLYYAPGDFHIDPLRPVPRALVTHGHSDHARPGHGVVMATRQTLEIMAIRYGEDFTSARQIANGRPQIGSVTVSFHPADHVLGSAQILITPDTGGLDIGDPAFSTMAQGDIALACAPRMFALPMPHPQARSDQRNFQREA